MSSGLLRYNVYLNLHSILACPFITHIKMYLRNFLISILLLLFYINIHFRIGSIFQALDTVPASFTNVLPFLEISRVVVADLESSISFEAMYFPDKAVLLIFGYQLHIKHIRHSQACLAH